MDKPWNAGIYWKIKLLRTISWFGGAIIIFSFLTAAYYYFTDKNFDYTRMVPAFVFAILAILSEMILKRWKYITCKKCGKRIRVKEDWYCDKCGHTQGEERHITLKCNECKASTNIWHCEHCHEEFTT
ncbi:MAG: hypothetical protein SVO01_08560 [Thermotogota bacterium]|nr:hypothetical protein [Thermotogota bacterium]